MTATRTSGEQPVHSTATSQKPHFFYGEDVVTLASDTKIIGAGRDDDFGRTAGHCKRPCRPALHQNRRFRWMMAWSWFPPCTMDYHINEFPWEDIMHHYCSPSRLPLAHQTSTCSASSYCEPKRFSDSQRGARRGDLSPVFCGIFRLGCEII